MSEPRVPTTPRFAHTSAAQLHQAYASGQLRPSQVVAHTLHEAHRLESAATPLEAFVILDDAQVLAQAKASDARWASGQPRGPLDGVPVAVKDEFDVQGYPTAAGTRFMGQRAAAQDCVMVERLRAAGAIILGKTSMHEIGLGGSGVNPGGQTARNPFDPRRFTGGSSSGSGAAVGAGVCPLAIGSDAGGSIRIPAALCGVYGLKPTYGRVPITGGALLAWTLDHVGPLGASLQDLASFMDVTAGADAHDRASQEAPAWRPVGLLRPGQIGQLRLAWSRAACEGAKPQTRRAFMQALERLRAAGAHVEEVTLPWADQIQPVGYVTLVSEAAASQREWLKAHRQDYSLPIRLMLAIGERVSAAEYLHAQRVRTLIRQMFDRVLEGHDAFLSPTTGDVAQVISQAALQGGEVHSQINADVSRFTFAGNLTGLPALTMPLAQDEAGMPMGIQLMGAAWSEAALLRAAATLEPLLEGLQRGPAARALSALVASR